MAGTGAGGVRGTKNARNSGRGLLRRPRKSRRRPGPCRTTRRTRDVGRKYRFLRRKMARGRRRGRFGSQNRGRPISAPISGVGTQPETFSQSARKWETGRKYFREPRQSGEQGGNVSAVCDRVGETGIVFSGIAPESKRERRRFRDVPQTGETRGSVFGGRPRIGYSTRISSASPAPPVQRYHRNRR
jgi:hypothetical protein